MISQPEQKLQQKEDNKIKIYTVKNFFSRFKKNVNPIF
jgi:hypothetical protein